MINSSSRSDFLECGYLVDKVVGKGTLVSFFFGYWLVGMLQFISEVEQVWGKDCALLCFGLVCYCL